MYTQYLDYIIRETFEMCDSTNFIKKKILINLLSLAKFCYERV